MELAHYIRVLRRQWLPFSACVVACILAAAALAALSTPMYEARAQLFVSGGGASRDLDQTYEGGLLAQQRARSYAELVTSPGVARAVIDQLGLPDTPAGVQGQLEASVPLDTVLIDVTATAASAQRAKGLADAVAVQLPRFVSELETTPGDRGSPVSLSVASRPDLPTEPSSPQTAVYLALGLLLGLALGVTAAVLRDALDDRVRTDDEAAAAAGVPVVGSVADGSAPGAKAMTAVGMDGYRRLRTNVSALTGSDGLRLLVTSAAAERGSARAVAGLGVAFAEAGCSVVLVDANLWRPKLGALLGLPPSTGLAEVLLDGVPVEDALCPWEGDPRIEVLQAGARSGPGSDVLSSRRLAGALSSLSDRADVVIVDSPALLKATDAAVLAPLMSGVLLLTRLPSTRAQQLAEAARELDSVGAQILGVVAASTGGHAGVRAGVGG